LILDAELLVNNHQQLTSQWDFDVLATAIDIVNSYHGGAGRRLYVGGQQEL
jgi:hypothetical protein